MLGIMRETTAKCSSSVPDVEGQEIQGLTWRAKQNPGFWMAFIGILAAAHHRRKVLSQWQFSGEWTQWVTCQYSWGNPWRRKHRKTRWELRKADQLQCYTGKTREGKQLERWSEDQKYECSQAGFRKISREVSINHVVGQGCSLLSKQ